MRQLHLMAFGEPSEVIQLNTLSEPALGPEDVLVSIEAASLNPSDFCSSAACMRSGRPSPSRSVQKVSAE